MEVAVMGNPKPLSELMLDLEARLNTLTVDPAYSQIFLTPNAQAVAKDLIDGMLDESPLLTVARALDSVCVGLQAGLGQTVQMTNGREEFNERLPEVIVSHLLAVTNLAQVAITLDQEQRVEL
jgi:hypothetical protein